MARGRLADPTEPAREPVNESEQSVVMQNTATMKQTNVSMTFSTRLCEWLTKTRKNEPGTQQSILAGGWHTHCSQLIPVAEARGHGLSLELSAAWLARAAGLHTGLITLVLLPVLAGLSNLAASIVPSF